MKEAFEVITLILKPLLKSREGVYLALLLLCVGAFVWREMQHSEEAARKLDEQVAEGKSDVKACREALEAQRAENTRLATENIILKLTSARPTQPLTNQ